MKTHNKKTMHALCLKRPKVVKFSNWRVSQGGKCILVGWGRGTGVGAVAGSENFVMPSFKL